MQKRYLYNPQTDLIGKGGSADVYKAYDNNLKRVVAIKRCSSGASSNKSVLKEIAGYCDLKHQNIIQYYDYFDETITDSFGGTQNIEYGVMEYANNGDFTQIVNKSIKVTEEEFKELLTGILDGLDYLHGNNEWNRTVIHRDLKPANILLSKTGNKLIPKICDFGISKSISEVVTNNTVTLLFSTPEYTAPEQINSKIYGVDGLVKSNADYWALGCIVYEYFTGKTPFGKRSDGTPATEIQNNILDAEPEYPSSIPQVYKKFIKQCLVKKATRRIEYASDLKQILAGKIINTTKSPDNKPIKWRFFLKIAIILLFTVLATLLFLNNSKKDEPQKVAQEKIKDTIIEVQPLEGVQISKDELSSIIKILLLENNADISYNNWGESNNTNLQVEWKTDNVVESNKFQQEYGMYKREGKFVPKIYGNICYNTYFDFDVQKTDWINTKIELSSSWNITLIGNRSGFSYIDILSETAPEMESIDVLEYLKKDLGLVFISGNEKEGLYRINAKNYKQSVLKYWKSCGSAGCSVGIEINLLSDEGNTGDWRTNFDEVWGFREGFAVVRKNNKWGYVDANGTVKIPLIYDNAYGFINGVAWVVQNGKNRYINKNGACVKNCR